MCIIKFSEYTTKESIDFIIRILKSVHIMYNYGGLLIILHNFLRKWHSSGKTAANWVYMF